MDWPQIENELSIRTSRASGAGGQHVNKTETKVELVLDLNASEAFTDEEKRRLRYHLKKKLRGGVLTLTDQSSRSQHTNRERALKRLYKLLEEGTREIPRPHKGKAFVANRKKRLERKRRRSEVKAGRRKRFDF